MGRTKSEGTKNLIRIIDSPRFQYFHFTDGKKTMKLLLSNSSYNRITSNLEKMGYRAINE